MNCHAIERSERNGARKKEEKAARRGEEDVAKANWNYVQRRAGSAPPPFTSIAPQTCPGRRPLRTGRCVRAFASPLHDFPLNITARHSVLRTISRSYSRTRNTIALCARRSLNLDRTATLSIERSVCERLSCVSFFSSSQSMLLLFHSVYTSLF